MGRRPCGREEDPVEVAREAGLVRFTRRERGLEARLEICVLPTDTGELRRLRMRNTGDRPRSIEVTTHGEVALQETAAHAGHPAFSRLFIQTEAVPASRALLFSRRPRANGEFHPWMMHALIEPAEISWETDRGRFLGRGGSPRAPRALRDASPLAGTTGDVLDPGCTLRTVVRLQPGEEAQRTFLLGGAPDRVRALELVAKLQTPDAIAGAYAEAARREADLWASLELDARRVAECERLAGALLYGEPGEDRRGSAPSAARAAELLAARGIDQRTPWLLMRVAEFEEGEALRAVAGYWRALGLSLGLVVATPDEACVWSVPVGQTGAGRFRLTDDLSVSLAELAGVVVGVTADGGAR
jgi:cyclic beta-1,2-glucan synthetase